MFSSSPLVLCRCLTLPFLGFLFIPTGVSLSTSALTFGDRLSYPRFQLGFPVFVSGDTLPFDRMVTPTPTLPLVGVYLIFFGDISPVVKALYLPHTSMAFSFRGLVLP